MLILAGVLVLAGWALSPSPGAEAVTAVPGPAHSSDLYDDRPSVVVLPLDNFSPDADDAYFADGMEAEIVSRLSSISGLRGIELITLNEVGHVSFSNPGLGGGRTPRE